jgi:hypothetical protein
VLFKQIGKRWINLDQILIIEETEKRTSVSAGKGAPVVTLYYAVPVLRRSPDESPAAESTEDDPDETTFPVEAISPVVDHLWGLPLNPKDSAQLMKEIESSGGAGVRRNP